MRLLGNGEYESAFEGEVPPSVHHARDYFLQAVKKIAPEVLEDLSREPFERYRATGIHFDENAHKERLQYLNLYDRIRELTRLRYAHEWSSVSWLTHFEGEAVAYDERISAMQKSIFEWSLKWGLDEGWCRERAFQTLDEWCTHQEFFSERQWNYEPVWETHIAFGRGQHPKITFEYKTLYPREGHRSEVSRRILSAFKERLKEFLDEREQMAKEAGMRQTPTKREESHFEWLVCFQVKKMPYSEILKRYNSSSYATAIENGDMSERTKPIRKAVNEVARFINLSLRKDGTAPGRRPRR